MNKIGIPKPSVDGEMNLESVAYDQDWYARQGFVPQKVDLNKVVDLSFVNYAVEVLGKHPQ